MLLYYSNRAIQSKGPIKIAQYPVYCVRHPDGIFEVCHAYLLRMQSNRAVVEWIERNGGKGPATGRAQADIGWLIEPLAGNDPLRSCNRRR